MTMQRTCGTARSRFATAAISVLAIAALGLGAPALAQETTLSAVNFVPNNSSFGRPFAKWVDEVNAKGKGIIQINIRPAGSISPFQMGNAIKTGVVDMANLPPTFYQNLLPIGDSIKLMTKVPAEQRANGAWAFFNELHNQHVNAYYLTTWGYGVPFHLYLTKKIDSPDLKGLKIRVTPVYRAFFKALGADVIQTPPADVYTALERGTIDGYGWPVWDIKSFGWDKVTKYRVDPGFYQTASAIIINLDKWKSLTKAQQDFLNAEGQRLEMEVTRDADKENERYRKEQADAGVQVILFQGDVAKQFLKTSRDAAWEEAYKLDPVNAAKLRKLIADD